MRAREKINLCGLFLIVVLMVANIVSARCQSDRIIHAKHSDGDIKIDGELSELSWQGVDWQEGFWQNFPDDTTQASTQTRIGITFNDNFIFIAAECFDAFPEKEYVISSLRRDFTTASDLFEVIIDPFRDKLNGFAFGVSPLGVQREGMISFGSQLDWGWDNKWFVETKRHADRWVVEMAIPLRTLRFESGSTEWNINFLRSELKRNELSAWCRVGRVYTLQSLAFAGTVVFDQPVLKNGNNISIIPYISARTNNDYNDNNNDETKFNAGVDAKVAVTSSLNLDLTVNPDFSQVEVDKQVTNLSRFEIFFPERRQFFIENSDLFAKFGFGSIRPFFSRRIGVGADPYTGLFKQIPITYGARLSGRLNDKWRIGVMNLQTAKHQSLNLPSINYAVAAAQRQIFARSNIAAIVINKQNVSDSVHDFRIDPNKYDRIVGLDYNLASRDNKWEGKFFFHQELTRMKLSDSYSHASYLNYNSKRFYFEHNHEYVGKNFRPETGYVPRHDYFRLEPNVGIWLYPKKSKLVNQHGPYAGGDVFWRNTDHRMLDADMDYGWIVNFQSTAYLSVFYRFDYTYLFSVFDPTNTGGVALPDSTSFVYHSVRIRYQSNTRKVFNYFTSIRIGEYFNGNICAASGNFYYRLQPFGNIGLDYAINFIRLPAPYSNANLLLIGPSVDWAFSKKVFLKAVFQYNNQINNFNTNIRFQWRFKPVSDLYLVYSDNYTDQFRAKNRGLVVKLTYWLNL